MYLKCPMDLKLSFRPNTNPLSLEKLLTPLRNKLTTLPKSEVLTKKISFDKNTIKII